MKRANVTFVTAFTPAMFKATGQNLLHSHEKHWDRPHPDFSGRTRMMIGQQWPTPDEACDAIREPGMSRIFLLDVLQDPWLVDWLIQNRDAIPKALGGCSPRCDCTTPDHDYGCWNHRWNRNASLWLRKVVAIRMVMDQMAHGRLIWVDSDSLFLAPFSHKTLDRWFNRKAVFYAWGTRRNAPQTGIVGYDLDRGGREIHAAVIERYTDGAFRQLPRWDDGFMLGQVASSRPDQFNDLAEGSESKNPFPETEMATYFKQWKGLHAKLGLLT